MADIEVQYKGSTIKQQTGSGTVTLHTEGKYMEDDVDIVYTAPSGGTPEYVYSDTDTYTFAEAASGTPAAIYPDFIGDDWTSTSTSKRRMWYCYSTNNGSQTNAFIFASIAIGTSNPPGSVVNGRQNSSGVTTVSTGTGSAITVKFTAGATVKIVKLKNPKIDSFS